MGRTTQSMGSEPRTTAVWRQFRRARATSVMIVSGVLVLVVALPSLATTPHERYRALATDKPIVDIWGVTGNGVRV